MVRVQTQLSESVQVDSLTHRRLVIEWSLIYHGEHRPNESEIQRTILEGVAESAAGIDAVNQESLTDCAVDLLELLQLMNGATSHVTVWALGSSASAYLVEG